MYVRMYVCMYVCMCVRMYVGMYVCMFLVWASIPIHVLLTLGAWNDNPKSGASSWKVWLQAAAPYRC